MTRHPAIQQATQSNGNKFYDTVKSAIRNYGVMVMFILADSASYASRPVTSTTWYSHAAHLTATIKNLLAVPMDTITLTWKYVQLS